MLLFGVGLSTGFGKVAVLGGFAFSVERGGGGGDDAEHLAAASEKFFPFSSFGEAHVVPPKARHDTTLQLIVLMSIHLVE